MPTGTANILLFVTVGMIWSAARLFHGRRVRRGPMFAGAALWLVAWMFPLFAHSAAARLLSLRRSLIAEGGEAQHDKRKGCRGNGALNSCIA